MHIAYNSKPEADKKELSRRKKTGPELKEGTNTIRIVCWPPDERVMDFPERSAAFADEPEYIREGFSVPTAGTGWSVL